jgi:uncharacterized repeat protein (TIGR02543 family)
MLDLNGAVEQDFPVLLEPESDGKVARPIRDPQRAGYSFAGWFSDREGLVPFDFDNTAVTKMTVVYAIWTEIRWDVVFYWNDGARGEYDRQSVLDGSYAVFPALPVRYGRGFAGWGTGVPESEPFTFDEPVTADKNLYAQWDDENYYIHYSMNYEGGAVSYTPVPMNTELTEPSLLVPQRTGFGFGGWFETPDCDQTQWTGGVITEDKTVYAKWQTNGYEVTFIKGAAWSTDTYTVTAEHGTQLAAITPELLADPANAAGTLVPGNGWTLPSDWGFIRWAVGSQSGPSWNFDSPVTSNMTLTGVWVQNRYTITLDKMDGAAPTVIADIEAGTMPNLGAAPQRAGHTFGGWYTDTLCTTAYIPAPLYRDITLYAKWTAQVYTVTFNLQSGTISGNGSPVTRQVSYGQRAAPPAVPMRAGYSFTGWYTNSSGGTLVDFGAGAAAVITQNTPFYAQWRQIVTLMLVNPDTGGTVVTTLLAGETHTITNSAGWGVSIEGWYPGFNSESLTFSGSKVNNGSTITVNANTTYYARLYYRVTFTWYQNHASGLGYWVYTMNSMLGTNENVWREAGTSLIRTVDVISGTRGTLPIVPDAAYYEWTWNGNHYASQSQSPPIRMNTEFQMNRK